jgi:hypothetical protein
MPLWAGQSVGLCHHTQASELMAELIAKADVFSPDLNHCRPSFLGECKRAGLLKNSVRKNPQKLDRVRMPYKRFAGIA